MSLTELSGFGAGSAMMLTLPMDESLLRNAGSDDHALVIAARGGDRAAFARLYERFAPMVHGILLAHASRTAVADLVQQTFLLALERLESLRDAGAFGPWIARIARNLATDHHRGRFRSETHWNESSPLTEAAAPRHDAESLAVLDAIGRLPAAYRETLMLRLVEGLTGPEIAATTGLTHGSVRVNLHRGMKRLRKELGI